MKMTRCTFTFLLCVCASFFLRAQGPAQREDPDAPIMKFDTTTYWFDTVFQGSTVDHEFRFRNTGKTPLIISNVQGSSGSVVPYYPREPVAPGQSAMIRVVFNTTGKIGPQTKTVTVTCNATEPVLILQLKGIVVIPPPDPNAPILKFDATTFSFDTIPQQTVAEGQFRFTNTGKEPLIITAATPSCGCMSTTYPKEPIAPGKTGVITVNFDSGSKMGNQEKTITVQSNSADGIVILRVKGFVVVPVAKPGPAFPGTGQ